MRSIITLSLLALLAAPVLAQRPGGSGGPPGGGGGGQPGGGGRGGMRGGGGGFSAESSFNWIQQSYGGTGDTIDYSKVTPELRDMVNRFNPNDPMPTSGTISRAQYADVFNKKMEARRAQGAGGGGNFNRGGNNNPDGNATIQPATPAQPGVTVTLGGNGGNMRGGGDRGGNNGGERTINDDELLKRFSDLDANKDGRISFDEAQRSDGLRPLFAYYDASKDGVVDMAEFKVYMLDRMNRRTPDANAVNGGQPNNGGYPQNNYPQNEYPRPTPPPVVEEAKPVVYRYGNLPLKELPSWWEDVDDDKDGQIAMHEWREHKKTMADFLMYDTNGDGLITVEEYLRWKRNKDSGDGKTTSSKDSGNKDSRGNERKSKDNASKGGGGGGNPFREKK